MEKIVESIDTLHTHTHTNWNNLTNGLEIISLALICNKIYNIYIRLSKHTKSM